MKFKIIKAGTTYKYILFLKNIKFSFSQLVVVCNYAPK